MQKLSQLWIKLFNWNLQLKNELKDMKKSKNMLLQKIKELKLKSIHGNKKEWIVDTVKSQIKLDKKEIHKQIKEHKITKLQLYKKELKKSIDKIKSLFDDIQFEHINTETALNGNIITYFVRQKKMTMQKTLIMI